MARWVRKWEVPGTNNTWTVSMDAEGNYGCSCPVWRFAKKGKRQECDHIRRVKGGEVDRITEKPKAEYVLANVRKPTYVEGENKLLIPLIRLPDTVLMEATIAFQMLRHGYTMAEIREIRQRIPKQWTAEAVIAHVERNGEAEYPPDREDE